MSSGSNLHLVLAYLMGRKCIELIWIAHFGLPAGETAPRSTFGKMEWRIGDVHQRKPCNSEGHNDKTVYLADSQ